MKEMAIAEVIAQMRAIKDKAQNTQLGETQRQQVEFAQLLKTKIDDVNAVMKDADLKTANFAKDVPGLHELEVMAAMQKSGVAYTALNQVRNKMLSAYQEVMNMTV